MSLTVQRYVPSLLSAWNTFNIESSAAHFLFDRGFMDYHATRFTDASLTFWQGETLIGLFPANIVGTDIHSHQGLTFGGLITKSAGVDQTLQMIDLCVDHFRQSGIERIHYKPVPWIYHRFPSEADVYSLFRHDAQLTRRDVTTTISNRRPGPLSSRRRRGIRKAEKSGVTIRQSERWNEFWEILQQVLQSRHGVAPVHSVAEIKMLADRFPANIKLFTAERNETTIAGVVIFETLQVAHAQYISSNDIGRESGALDALLTWLIQHYQETKEYFDFGISTEDSGRRLNVGLASQKEEFGGGAVAQDTYIIHT